MSAVSGQEETRSVHLRLFGLRDGVRIEGKTKNKKLAKRFKEKQRLKKTIA